jgi:AcrR family transcriptional regulator
LEERRQEIVSAARKFFIANGFEKTAIGDIARELHIAHGLIYHYYKSKTELLYAVVDQIATEQLAQSFSIIEEFNGNALDCIQSLFSRENDSEQFGKLFEELIEDPGIMNYVSEKFFVSMTPVLIRLIERGNADGSWNCDDPELAAVFILQGARGVMNLHCGDSKHPPKDLSIVLRVLGASTG